MLTFARRIDKICLSKEEGKTKDMKIVDTVSLDTLERERERVILLDA